MDKPTSVVRLDEAARTALDLTRHQLSHRASIAADLPVVPPVLATEGKVVQVLVNLLLNAAHALERRPGGRVVLRTGHEAQKSWVEVEDNGPGVPEALRNKIFDPFFTTKEVGKGTGLGLSVSRSIMRSLGGDLVLHPGADGGATFRLHLPAPSPGRPRRQRRTPRCPPVWMRPTGSSSWTTSLGSRRPCRECCSPMRSSGVTPASS